MKKDLLLLVLLIVIVSVVSEPYNSSDGINEGPTPGQGGGTGYTEGQEIFGDPSSAKIEGENVNIEIHPEYGGEIEINDSDDEDRQNVSSDDEDEPLNYSDIIDNYFDKLVEESDDNGGIETTIPSTLTTTILTTSTTSTSTTTTILCNGCMVDNRCMPLGTRVNNSYCNLDNVMKPQLDNDAECQNNYQCKSNFCTNNACRDIYREIQENRNLLQEILDWINNFIGGLL